jgi:hypothetical protein
MWDDLRRCHNAQSPSRAPATRPERESPQTSGKLVWPKGASATVFVPDAPDQGETNNRLGVSLGTTTNIGLIRHLLCRRRCSSRNGWRPEQIRRMTCA